uniref:Kinetochore protein Nuf2 N-terminal domain-containing protein n=1 Tax=Leersia perrieri TaxID=77586 RepID=A0A0D9XH31_9ORYZ
MASNLSFPEMSPAQIAEALHHYGLAPTSNLRADDIANQQPDLLPAVFSAFLHPTGDDQQQLGFQALAALDNPEHHVEALRVLRLHRRAKAFLESIHFPGFTLRDLIRPDPRRLLQVLSALVNYLYYLEEKLALLQPIINHFPNSHDRRIELKAKIADVSLFSLAFPLTISILPNSFIYPLSSLQHQKAIEDHELQAQMEEPMVLKLQEEVNSLKLKLVDYNKQQLALRAKANSINEKKEEKLRKISEADFELMKLAEENSKLHSKIVQSPEKLQRALEEKKAARAELKNAEKIAMQSVQEKTATLDIYNKAYEKLSKHFSKIQVLQEQVWTSAKLIFILVTAAKTLEKEVKARKAKISDESVTIMALDAKIVEWDRKEREMDERAKAKMKERDQIITDENQKLAALRSEAERKLQHFQLREMEVEETVAKADKLFADADLVSIVAAEEQRRIYAKFQEIGQAFNIDKDNFSTVLDQVDEVSKETLERFGRQDAETFDTSTALKREPLVSLFFFFELQAL